MKATTEIHNKYHGMIPTEIREKLNIDKDSIIEWEINKDNEVVLNFRKRSDLLDIVGIGGTQKPTDSVKITKKNEKGENIDSN